MKPLVPTAARVAGLCTVVLALVMPAMSSAREGAAAALEKADLQRCLDGEAAQREREAAHEARAAAHRAALGEIADEAGRLQADRRTLDRTQPGATTAFNARIDAHEARLARHNAEAQALNSAAAELRTTRAALVEGCDGRAHSLTHEAQIRQRAGDATRPAAPVR